MVDQIAWVKSSFPVQGEDSPVFPTVSGLPPSKQGFADTYQWAAKQMGLPISGPTGLRLFTGHSGRATGAQHLAGLGVELWRIQLFGRWGSDAFVLYVRDAPLANLHRLAQETSLSASMASAKSELASLLKQVQDLRLSVESSTVIKEGPLPLTVSDLLDGDASLSIVASELPPPPVAPRMLC